MLLRAVAINFGTALLGAWMVLWAVVSARGVGPISFADTLYSNDQAVNVLFKTWAPNGWDRLRGVIFDIPGSGGDTRDVTNNVGWQQRLTNMGFAIVGVQFQNTGIANWYWGMNPNEIASNMQTMLDSMAGILSHPEISNAPIFLSGISHGARGASAIAQSIPERTLGFVSDHGDLGLFNFTDEVSKVPGLLVTGAYDATVTPSQMSNAYDTWRSWGSEIAQAVDWGSHAATNANLRHAFIDEVIKLRYPEGEFPSLTPGNPLELVDIPYESGWRGEANPVNTFTNQVTPIAWPQIAADEEASGVLEDGSWLPSETMAKVFRAHNSYPIGIAKNNLQLNVGPPLEEGPPLVISVDVTSGPYDGVDLYDESGLIAEFGPGSGVLEFPYEPAELGNQTFVAVMHYTAGGQSRSASSYVTYNVTYAPEPTVLWGDYNGNGIIDAADYTAWRDALAMPGSSLQNDPSPFIVNEADFVYWRSHFGETLGAGGSSNGPLSVVPEPSTALLFEFSVMLLSGMRRSLGAMSRRNT